MTAFTCRLCNAATYESVLDYGRVALADSFLPLGSDLSQEETFQLTLVFCTSCAHVQILEILDPVKLFSHYVWETGIPASIRDYCESFVDAVMARVRETPRRVVEIASNDGTMLQAFQKRGLAVLGVDPAKNIGDKARARGIPTLSDFFATAIAERILEEHGEADLIVARNVLAHVADLHGLMNGVRVLLSARGTAVIEVPHLLTLHNELQYDQVFHEHIGYHSLDSIRRLAERHSLTLVHVEEAWIHGGSIRAYLQPAKTADTPSEAVQALLRKEHASRILAVEGWRDFAARALSQKKALRDMLSEARRLGQRVVGYGASGKGQVMIQFCELGPELVAMVADKSTMKVGKLAPGSHIPIVSPETMRSERPDIVVLFAWNFAEEIVRQEHALVTAGTRFIHPLPSPRYLG